MSRDALLALCTLLASLSLAGAVLVLRGGLRERLQARLALVTAGAAEMPGQGAQLLALAPLAPSQLALRQRILRLLGRSPHLPPSHAFSLPLVLLAALGAGLVAAWAIAWLMDPLIGIAGGGAVGLLVTYGLFRLEADRHRDALFLQVPDAISFVLRAVRAGLPVSEALRTVAREMPSPTREEFDRAVSHLAIGTALDQALLALAERTRLAEYKFLAVVIALQAQTGGNLGEALENLAEITRQRVGMRGKILALTAEARLSAKILIALPLVCGAAIAVLVPGHLTPMVQEPQGRKMLLGGVAALLIGVLIIRAMLRSAAKD
ncbi:type II secretion system F family protein [Roseicella aerolata]|uniref:Type II secretion system F family protein n=1 Tax=Roseicella aerolata TaxID=2883479 RepID=A0A9X1IH63_9PROT|nr:type II secretion system F family protein [Roseicella aerolata]MCB4824766.1 type II secretion system F family protein [Roseicella aerolata]